MNLSKNLKFLRKKRKVTQDDLATFCGVKRPTLSSYENNLNEPSATVLKKMSEFFTISLDDLLNTDLENTGWAGKKGPEVLAITIDKDGNENIEFVPEKAVAGYVTQYGDPEYLKELSTFHLPFLSTSGKTMRAFEIEGDSMLPNFQPQSVVIGERIFEQDLKNLKPGETCVLVTENGIVLKKVYHKPDQGKFFLVSNNPGYESYNLPEAEVNEIWKFMAYLAKEIPDPRAF
ncbi:MAG: helix-turn-helix domain-containing protein [Flammeovirgaceae bacterium]|nr:helix-turn-helix domain-containing protein [Flammeovirgaceae bacterium]